MDLALTYETVPYPDFVHPRTNPDSIAAMARLHGFQCAAAATARILELGCGQGGNLISLASLFPRSRCVGIDLSAGHIQAGQATIEALGLTNVQLHAGDIADFPARWLKHPEDAEFDYIIVHGVYSWVPENVRKHLLRIAREQLSDRGIAFVSYNTYPGWHAKGMVREMMRHHAASTADAADDSELPTSPLEQIEEAKRFLAELANSVPETSGYGRILREEVHSISQSNQAYLVHEQFEAVNQPRYFHEFAEEIAASELRYVCEASLTYVPSQSDAMKRRLAAQSMLQREQSIDYLCNRSFRQSLICRADRAGSLVDQADAFAIHDLWLSSDAICLGADEQPLLQGCRDLPEGELRIVSGEGASVTLSSLVTKAAMLHLASISPENLSFNQLWQQLTDNLPILLTEPAARALLAVELVQLAHVSMVRLHASKLPLTTQVAAKPLTSPLARRQAMAGAAVTSQRHAAVQLDEPTRHLITLCDGQRDRETLIAEMVRFVTRDGGTLQHEGQPVSDLALLTELVREKLEPNLKNLAKMGFLVPSPSRERTTKAVPPSWPG